MVKLDPYKNKELYYVWREKAESGALDTDIGRENCDTLLKYLKDMEIGLNTGNSATKGSRSFIHLKSMKDRLLALMRKIRAQYGLERVIDIDEEQLHLLFANIANGTLTKKDGQKYKAVWDYVKVFKAFWHWYQRVQKKKGVEVPDITADLDTRQEKPDWVYLPEDEVKVLTEKARIHLHVYAHGPENQDVRCLRNKFQE